MGLKSFLGFHFRYWFLFFVCFGMLAISCRTTRNAEKPVVIKPSKTVEEKDAEALLKNITDSAFTGRWINAKATVNAKVGDETNSFNINLRMCRDSAIWVSITPLLGIEAARVLITQDSVKFIDRIHHEYKIADYKFLNDMLNTNVDFDIIQGVLTGNLFAYKKNKFNSVYIEDKYYILSTFSKRKLKRSLEDKDPNKPVVQDFWVSDDNYRITKLSIEDNRVNKTLVTEYSDFRQTDAGTFPFKSTTQIKAEKEIMVEIEYNKITVGEPLEFTFSIPARYRIMR